MSRRRKVKANVSVGVNTVEPIVRPNGIVLTNKELQSPGADLMIDFHAFRIGSPLRLTFTAAWPKGEGFYYDFGFSFSIN